MCMFIVWHPRDPVQQTTIYTPGIGTLLYILISSGKNSAFVHFAAAVTNQYNLALLPHQVPITAG